MLMFPINFPVEPDPFSDEIEGKLLDEQQLGPHADISQGIDSGGGCG